MPFAKVLHRKVSPVPDGGDPNLVLPSDWNDSHIVQIYQNEIDIPPDAPSLFDDEFDDGVLDSAWTKFTPEGVTNISEEQGGVFFDTLVTGGSTARFNGIYRNIPAAGTRIFYAKVRRHSISSNYNGPLIGLRNPSNGNVTALMFVGHSAYGSPSVLTANLTGGISLSSETNLGMQLFASEFYIKLEITDTNWSYALSLDGRRFSRTIAVLDHWAGVGNPSQLCIGTHAYVVSSSRTAHLCSFEWLRMGVDGVYHGSMA